MDPRFVAPMVPKHLRARLEARLPAIRGAAYDAARWGEDRRRSVDNGHAVGMAAADNAERFYRYCFAFHAAQKPSPCDIDGAVRQREREQRRIAREQAAKAV